MFIQIVKRNYPYGNEDVLSESQHCGSVGQMQYEFSDDAMYIWLLY